MASQVVSEVALLGGREDFMLLWIKVLVHHPEESSPSEKVYAIQNIHLDDTDNMKNY